MRWQTTRNLALVIDSDMLKNISIIVIISQLISSCSSDPCLKNSGDQSYEIRLLSDNIQEVDLYNNLALDIYIDTVNYLAVYGGENIIPHIQSEIEGTLLSITNNNDCRFLRDFDRNIRLELHINGFSTLRHFGSNEIVMHDTLKTDEFEFESLDGSGRVIVLVSSNEARIRLGGLTNFAIAGHAQFAHIDLQGSGFIHGENYSAISSYIYQRGTGDCSIRVQDKLTCKIDAIGNLIYFGSPELNVESHAGKGELIFGGP